MGIDLEAENGTKRLLSAGVPSNVHTLHIMPLSVMVFFLPAIAGRFGLASAIDLRVLPLALFECLTLQTRTHDHALFRIRMEMLSMSHPKNRSTTPTRWKIVSLSNARTRVAGGSISTMQIFFTLGRFLCLCMFSTSLPLWQPHLIH